MCSTAPRCAFNIIIVYGSYDVARNRQTVAPPMVITREVDNKNTVWTLVMEESVPAVSRPDIVAGRQYCSTCSRPIAVFWFPERYAGDRRCAARSLFTRPKDAEPVKLPRPDAGFYQ